MLTELEDLGKLTLVTGMNNTGKSQALLGLLPYALIYHYSRDKEKVKIPVDKKGKITQWEDDFLIN